MNQNIYTVKLNSNIIKIVVFSLVVFTFLWQLNRFLGIKFTVVCVVAIGVLSIIVPSFYIGYKSYYYLLPFFILCSVYLPFGIRSDFIILTGLILVSFYLKIIKKEKFIVNGHIIGWFVFAISPIAVAFFYCMFNGSFECINSKSFLMLQYWIRITIILFMVNNSSNMYDTRLLIRSCTLFYAVSLFVVFLGVGEALKILPDVYYKVVAVFYSPFDKFMHENMNLYELRRAVSILGHPSTYGYFCLVNIIITLQFKKNIIQIINRKIVIVYLFIGGIASGTKTFLIGIIVIAVYEMLKRKRNVFVVLSVLVLMITTLAIVYGYGKKAEEKNAIVFQVFYMASAIQSDGIWEFAFRRRFSTTNGLLAESYKYIIDNLPFGVGSSIIDGVFLGDSFYISSLLKHGIVGSAFFIVLIVIMLKKMHYAKSISKDENIKNILSSLIKIVLMNFVVGIGTESFTYTKVSDVIYFYCFLISYGVINTYKRGNLDKLAKI